MKMNIEVFPEKFYTANHPTDFCEMLIGGRKIVLTD